MEMNNLPKISEDLFGLVVKLNIRIFKHDEILRSLPFPPSHAKVIFYLVHNGALPMSSVAEHLSISRSNMTPIVDNLISKGFVNRMQDEKDRRIIMIEATDKAHELFKAQKKSLKEGLEERIKSLEVEEANQLHEAIQCILPLLDKLQ